jgi:hypothetical protein
MASLERGMAGARGTGGRAGNRLTSLDSLTWGLSLPASARAGSGARARATPAREKRGRARVEQTELEGAIDFEGI